jgi:uncharacterized protein DUF1501
MNRRDAIRSLAAGSLLMPGILSELLAQEGPKRPSADPLSPKPPPFPARAKQVIFLFMSGGLSHVDAFDPKPRLIADDGKTTAWNEVLPPAQQALQDKPLQTFFGPRWNFRPRGNSGLEISDLLPHIADCADDLCLIRSMKTDHLNHTEALLGLHCGAFGSPRPSLGSWLSYGLGTFNRNLPSFVVLAPTLPWGGPLILSSDFLPGEHQGVHVRPGPEPIEDLRSGAPSAAVQEIQLGLLDDFNRRHLKGREDDPALAARIRSFKTAFGLQREAPEAFDLSRESDATLRLYGLERGQTAGFGWQCLVARRLAERGVRFIELIDSKNGWDNHGSIKDKMTPVAKNVDRPVAALLRDLKARGMLDETLVVFTTEFGRRPFMDGATPSSGGRGHQSSAFSTWLAGGGVRPGMVYGKTDDYGAHVAENPVHVHDLHATILHLMGIDHERLTYRHGGRDFRLTDVYGKVVEKIIA